MLNTQFKWISSDFTTRVVKVCRNLLEAAAQIVNVEQVIDRIVKIFDALLYAQGKKPFKLRCLVFCNFGIHLTVLSLVLVEVLKL